jgi:hypothetical protein
MLRVTMIAAVLALTGAAAQAADMTSNPPKQTAICLDVGGQTLPSPDYLRDDIQYFPAGPEIQLPNARRAIQEYKASQKGEDAPPYNPLP